MNDRITHIDGDGVRAVSRAHGMKTLFDQIERFVPSDPREAAVYLSSQRSAQAIRIMMHVPDRDALRADVAL